MPALARSSAAARSGAREKPITFAAFAFDSAVCASSPLKRAPPPTGTSSLRPIMSMFSTAASDESGASGCSV